MLREGQHLAMEKQVGNKGESETGEEREREGGRGRKRQDTLKEEVEEFLT